MSGQRPAPVEGSGGHEPFHRAIAEALGCEESSFYGVGVCVAHGPGWPCRKAEHVAAALAPLVEARVREARADEVRKLLGHLRGGDGSEFDTYLAENLKKPLVLQGFLEGHLEWLS